MTVYVGTARLEEIQAVLDELQAAVDAKEVEIFLNGGEPVVWTQDERNVVMKDATLLAYLSDNDLACYPLSAAAVLFIEPP